MTGLARQVTLVLATVLTLVMNYLSNALPLFGNTNGQISDSLPNAFTPAGLTFAVWGPIFLGLAVFAVYQALPAGRSRAMTACSGLFAGQPAERGVAVRLSEPHLWPQCGDHAGAAGQPDLAVPDGARPAAP